MPCTIIFVVRDHEENKKYLNVFKLIISFNLSNSMAEALNLTQTYKQRTNM